MPDLEPEKKSVAPWWQPSLVLFFQLSGWIGIPIILAIYLGSWLDEKYGTAPWLYLGSVAAAFIISTIGIVREGAKAIKQMEKFDGDKTKQSHE